MNRKDIKIGVISLGCDKNRVDTEQMLGVLSDAGYTITSDEDSADVVIVNTCAFILPAREESINTILETAKRKEDGKCRKLVVTGCLAEKYMQELRTGIPEADCYLGIREYDSIAETIDKLFENEAIIDKRDGDCEIICGNRILTTPRHYAYLKIADGCDNFCTYCIVPYVRGREISREPKDIIMEIERLVKDGVKEVMLLGQNVDSYGKTLDNPVSFAQLLREIDKIEGLERIRFMTPHPKDIEEETLEVIRDSKKICNHIHFPLQSGSSRLLKLMNRKYTKEHYLEQVEMIRRILPDVSITTDIIVGFPGETEEDFEDTIDVVKKAKFDSAYTFIYSKRTGTPAARMENQVPEDVVKDRFNRLLATVNEVSHEHIRRYEGMDMKVLVEGKDDHEEGFVTGRMTNNILVHFAGDESLIGQIVTVHLDECKGFYYMGRLIED